MRSPSPLPAVLAVLCLAAPLSSQDARVDLRARIAAALEGIQRPQDIAEAAAELSRLGKPALEPLFERLGSGEGGRRKAALLGAIAGLPRADVLAFLAKLAHAGVDEGRRATALEVLASLGGRSELRLVLDVGLPGDSGAASGPTLRTACEGALLAITRRESGAPEALAGFFPRAAPAARAAIAAVLARAGGEQAPLRLAALLGSAGADADALLLLGLCETARSQRRCEDLLVLERVRGTLVNPDPRLVVLSCMAADKLRDHGAVPDLIVLLDDARASVRQGAHAALTSLTGSRLPADPQPWMAWLDAALAWWDERAESCRVALVSGTPAEAAQALEEVARQRLFVQEVVGLLELGLQRAEPDLVRSACRALGALPERDVRKTFAALIAHADPVVAEGARTALRRPERMHPVAVRSRNPYLPTGARTPAPKP